jgi:hypothetical protein
MNLPLTACFLLAAISASAQGPSAESATPPRPKLSAETVAKVLETLKGLEASVLNLRNTNLTSIIEKLTEASKSNAAAVRFFTDCDSLVNAERKDMTKIDARARAEQVQRSLEQQRDKKDQSTDEGNQAVGIRLGLRYLALTLEAHGTRDEDLPRLAPKLQSYLSDLVDSAKDLKGRAMGMIQRANGGGGPVVEAYQLQRYLKRTGWVNDATNISAIYEQILMKMAKPESLAGLWDTRILQEAAWNKGFRSNSEYELWLRDQMPVLRWRRGLSLHESGAGGLNALADLLKVIQENPSHPEAPQWVIALRELINESAEVPPSQGQSRP